MRTGNHIRSALFVDFDNIFIGLKKINKHAAVSFASEVMPLMEKYCWECHSQENAELGLMLDSYEGTMAGSDYGTVVEPGDPDGSLLVDMIAREAASRAHREPFD